MHVFGFHVLDTRHAAASMALLFLHHYVLIAHSAATDPGWSDVHGALWCAKIDMPANLIRF